MAGGRGKCDPSRGAGRGRRVDGRDGRDALRDCADVGPWRLEPTGDELPSDTTACSRHGRDRTRRRRRRVGCTDGRLSGGGAGPRRRSARGDLRLDNGPEPWQNSRDRLGLSELGAVTRVRSAQPGPHPASESAPTLAERRAGRQRRGRGRRRSPRTQRTRPQGAWKTAKTAVSHSTHPSLFFPSSRATKSGAQADQADECQEFVSFRRHDGVQAGGGNASASGTTGSGAHSIVVISERGSRLRWRAVHDAGQHLLGVGPAPGAVAAADLTATARMAARQGARSHKKRNAGNSLARLGEALAAAISRPSRAASRPRADAVLTARVRAVPQGEAEDRLQRAVGMSGLQVLAPSQEVGQARLMRRLLEAAIGHPPVPHQHAGEVWRTPGRRRLGAVAFTRGSHPVGWKWQPEKGPLRPREKGPPGSAPSVHQSYFGTALRRRAPPAGNPLSRWFTVEPEHAAGRGVRRPRRSALALVCLEQHGRLPAPGGHRLHQLPAHA